MTEKDYAAVCALAKELDDNFEEAHVIMLDLLCPTTYYLEET